MSGDEDDRRMFLDLKCSIPECFGEDNLASIYWVV